MTIVQVGDRLGWGPTKTREKLLAAGVKLRRPGNSPKVMKIDIDELAVKYRAGATLRQLGREYDLHASTIQRRLTAVDVELRPGGRQREFPQLDDRTWLAERYLDRQLSLLQIARGIGCDAETVREALVRHDIERRSLSDAQRARRCGAFSIGIIGGNRIAPRTP